MLLILFLNTLVLVAANREAYGGVGYFWHITDIHFNAYLNQKGCWRPEYDGIAGSRSQRGSSGRYGDYGCDTPWELVESAVKAMATRQDVDFLLWTGDAMSHEARLQLNQEKQLQLMQNMTDLFFAKFSSQFIFPALGHEDFHSRKELGGVWSRWLPMESMRTFEKGGYYFIERKEQTLQIIVLNTNLWANDRHKEKAEEQWKWLDEVFKKLKDSKKPVKACLVGHIPPGSAETIRTGVTSEHLSYTNYNNKRYINMVENYTYLIAGQFFGHLHMDAFRVMYDQNGDPIQWALIAPAVTPRRTNNPGLRLYKFDKLTGKILDYTQYYLDLTSANSNLDKEPVWKEEYNFSSYYKVSDITPQALHSLAEKFSHSHVGGSSDFHKYYRATFVNNGPPADTCDVSCIRMFYCAATKLDHEDYENCAKTHASAFSASTSSAFQQLPTSPAFIRFYGPITLAFTIYRVR